MNMNANGEAGNFMKGEMAKEIHPPTDKHKVQIQLKLTFPDDEFERPSNLTVEKKKNSKTPEVYQLEVVALRDLLNQLHTKVAKLEVDLSTEKQLRKDDSIFHLEQINEMERLIITARTPKNGDTLSHSHSHHTFASAENVEEYGEIPFSERFSLGKWWNDDHVKEVDESALMSDSEAGSYSPPNGSPASGRLGPGVFESAEKKRAALLQRLESNNETAMRYQMYDSSSSIGTVGGDLSPMMSSVPGEKRVDSPAHMPKFGLDKSQASNGSMMTPQFPHSAPAFPNIELLNSSVPSRAPMSSPSPLLVGVGGGAHQGGQGDSSPSHSPSPSPTPSPGGDVYSDHLTPQFDTTPSFPSLETNPAHSRLSLSNLVGDGACEAHTGSQSYSGSPNFSFRNPNWDGTSSTPSFQGGSIAHQDSDPLLHNIRPVQSHSTSPWTPAAERIVEEDIETDIETEEETLAAAPAYRVVGKANDGENIARAAAPVEKNEERNREGGADGETENL